MVLRQESHRIPAARPAVLPLKTFQVALLLLVTAGAADAQIPAPTAALEERVGFRERIFLTDREGRETEARFLGVSQGEIVALVGTDERRINPGDIGRVEKSDPLWNGALIGAIPFALAGMGAAGASCSPHCARDISFAGAIYAGIGAGVGLLIDRSIRGYSAVYGPALPPRNATSQGRPVTSLSELWTRVRAGDTIRVTTPDGGQFEGTFVRASAASLWVVAGGSGQLRELPAGEVDQVARRGNRYRRGALYGAALVGIPALVASASSDENALFAAAFAGASGALWGAGIGALIPKWPSVLKPGAPAAIRVEPLIGVRSGRAALSFNIAVSGGQ